MFNHIESRVSQCPIDGTVLTAVSYEPEGAHDGSQLFDFTFTAGTGLTRLQTLVWENETPDHGEYDLHLIDTYTTTLRWDRPVRITSGL